MKPINAQILARVSERLEVTREQLLGSSRRKSLVEARHLVFLLARELSRESFPELGATFGFDHTTVIHGVERIRRVIETDRVLRGHYDAIRSELSGPLAELEWIDAEIQRLRARAEHLAEPYRAEVA